MYRWCTLYTQPALVVFVFLVFAFLAFLSLVQFGISRSISIGSWHGCSSINELGERSLADETILVGVSINKELKQGMIQLRVRVALLVLDGLLDEPDEILLGLVEGVNWG